MYTNAGEGTLGNVKSKKFLVTTLGRSYYEYF